MNDDKNNNNDDHTRSDEFWDGFDEAKAQFEREKAAADANKKWNFSSNGNGKDKEDKKQSHFVQKYSEDKLLAEAVIVVAIPYFAVARQKGKELTLSLESSIPIDDNNEYKPYERTMYLNKPYTFRSKQDFEACVEKARTETRDSMYRKVKAIWLKYIDADDFHISICAADTIFTYYQDKIGLTHYLFFVGSPGSGKSNNLLVLKYLAYRNFTSTDVTAANIYQFLGSGQEGQGTLCEDEADRIDEDRQKMSIYKNGYITGFPVSRTDTSFGRKQMKFNTYCFKAFAAERFPDSFKAKGFNQRVLELQCSFGDPEEDITEVVNPAGEEEFQYLLDELNETRNLLLAVRLLYLNQRIPDIKLNIKAREKQLFKPVLRVFQKTDTLSELLPVVSRYVMQKREANFNTLDVFLYRTIKDLVVAQNRAEFSSRFLWDYIKSNLPGEESPGRVLSYESSEFGTLTQTGITQTFEHIFGAKPRRVNGIRMLAFDLTKLERLSTVYDLAIDIKVLSEEESSSEKSVPLVPDLTDIGIDKYVKTDQNERESEHEDTSKTDATNSIKVSKAAQPALKSDCNNVPYSEEYGHLIEMKELPSTGRTVYKCREHPDSPEYYDLKGIQESHFKPYHKKVE